MRHGLIRGLERAALRLTAVAGLVAVAALMGSPGAALAQSSGEGSVSLPIGTVAPDAALEDLDGNPVRLMDFATPGKPALIEFWATWCENCEELQPQMDAVQMRYGDRINVVAVAVGVSQSTRRIKRHLSNHDPGYPHLYDKRGNAARAYDAAVTSIVLMLDEEGKVVYTGAGGDQDLVGAVERLFGS